MNHRRAARTLLALVLALCILAPILNIGTPVAQAAGRTYRALLIGNNAYKVSPLRGCINDAKAMKSALGASTEIKYGKIELQTNLTASGIGKAIGGLSDWGADSNDVTLVFYSGHGYRNASNGETGIVGTDHKKYSFEQMEDALSKVSGTIVLLVDSCYSGGAIGKSVSAKGNSTSDFNKSVKGVFEGASKRYKNAKSMNGTKYHVITAAGGKELSYESGGNGYFTTGLTESMGWNATSGKRISRLVGDANGDGELSVGEAYTHTRDVVSDFRSGGDQNVQVSPAGSALVFVARESSAPPAPEPDLSVDMIPVASGVPSPSTAVIAPGQGLQLYTSKSGVSWKSSQTSVASVAKGLVVAKKKGKATITAIKGGKVVLKVSLVVTAESSVVSSVGLNASATSRKAGSSFRLKASVKPAGAYKKSIRWYSSNAAVASVDGGLVKARKAGTAKIYAISSAGISAVCTVSVSAPSVSRVQQKKAKVSVTVGKKLKLEARALPLAAANRKLTWKSSNTKIAKVDKSTGVVTAIKPGTVYITATSVDGGKTAKCKLTVKKKK